MRPGTEKAKVPGHAQQEQGQGKDDTNGQAFPLVADISFPGCGLGVFRIFTKRRFDHVEAGPAHHGYKIIATDQVGKISYRSLFAGKVDCGLLHTFDLVQLALNGVGTVGAGHAQQVQGDLFRF